MAAQHASRAAGKKLSIRKPRLRKVSRCEQEQQNQPYGSRPRGLPAPDIDLDQGIDQTELEHDP